MKKQILIITLFCTSNLLQGIIVFLKGSGCAGKSSLCKALLEHDTTWKLMDEDTLYIARSVEYFKSAFPQEFAAIETVIAPENIFHAVQRNQILFRENATAHKKAQAEIAIFSIKKNLDPYNSSNKNIQNEFNNELTEYMMLSIQNYAHAGFNVVIDSWLLSPEQIAVLKQKYRTVTVLAYCPLNALINRTLTRNYHAFMHRNLYAMRYFHQALLSFKYLYDFQKEPSQNSIDSITREEVNNALDVVALALPSGNTCGGQHLFSRDEFSYSQLHEYRMFFMKMFLDTDVLYITPKASPDFVIKTSGTNVQQEVQQFLTYIQEATQVIHTNLFNKS